MKHTIAAIALGGTLLCASLLAVAMEVSIEKTPTSDGSAFYSVKLTGSIAPQDHTKIEKIFRAYGLTETPPRFGLLWVNVTSPGGSVNAAMSIGRLLRRLNATVFAVDDCMSSCVLILASGLFRDAPKGRVGIHRPFLTDLADGASHQDVKALITKSRTEIAAYLDTMNVNTRLADDMYAIPPERVQILSKSDLTRYGLNQPDPVFTEMSDLAAAKRLGISREEYLRRKARVNTVCINAVKQRGTDGIGPVDACIDDVMAGRR